jgi:hypothetical protein
MINCERAKAYAQMLLKLVPNVIGCPRKKGAGGPEEFRDVRRAKGATISTPASAESLLHNGSNF